LGDNPLSGNNPSQFGYLRELVILSIYGPGNISGSIPSEIGNCSNLGRLDLIVNRIQGFVPMSIFRLPLSTPSVMENNLTVAYLKPLVI